MVMVFNTTFNNTTFISLRPVLLVEKTTDLLQVTDKLYHKITGFKLTTLVVIGTNCIGSYKFNYHTITTMTVPKDI